MPDARLERTRAAYTAEDFRSLSFAELCERVLDRQFRRLRVESVDLTIQGRGALDRAALERFMRGL